MYEMDSSDDGRGLCDLISRPWRCFKHTLATLHKGGLVVVGVPRSSGGPLVTCVFASNVPQDLHEDGLAHQVQVQAQALRVAVSVRYERD